MQYIHEAIEFYVGRACVSEIDYTIQDDGQGAYIKQWNIQDKSKPTELQLQTISNNLAPQIELEAVRQEKLEENQHNYDALRNGVKVVDGVPINIDPVSISNVSGQIILIIAGKVLGNPPLNIIWFDDDNIEHIYTEEQFMILLRCLLRKGL